MSGRFLTQSTLPLVRRFTRGASTSAGLGSHGRSGAFAAVSAVSAVFIAGIVTGAGVDIYGRSRGTRASSTETAQTFPEKQKGAAAVWRGTFDPGSNPRMTSQAAAPAPGFYDTVDEDDPTGLTLWQQTLRAEDMKRTNFVELDRNGDGYLERDDLIKAFGTSTDVDKLVEAADRDGDGHISYKEWLSLKAALAEAYEKDRGKAQEKTHEE